MVCPLYKDCPLLRDSNRIILIGGIKFGDLVLSIEERYLIQCPLFGVSFMRDSTVLKIVYALDIKFWVRWCTCSMWRMLLPYYLLFRISVILFLKTDIRILYTF